MSTGSGVDWSARPFLKELYMDINSLMLTHNRVAVDGEQLVAHRFKSGTIRMVARDGFERWARIVHRGPLDGGAGNGNSISSSIKNFVSGFITDFVTFFGFIDPDAQPSEDEPQPIVEIRSDALLRICDTPFRWRDRYHMRPCEEALFSGHSLSGAPYGTLWFGNGLAIPMQAVDEAQNVTVIDQSWPESLEFRP